MKRLVKKVYKDLISLKDYDVKLAIENNDNIVVVLEDSEDRMLLTVEQLKEQVSESADFFESMFDTEPYKLYNYFWNPTKFLTPQEEARQSMLGEEWYEILKDEFEKDYLINLGIKIAKLRKVINIFPDKEDTFKAYKLTQPKDIKVVILGLEPYSHKASDGLAFSSKDIFKLPFALDVIYKAIEEDIKFGLYLDKNNDLTYWAEQGVLLLNTVLTVTQGQPKSHYDFGWQKFTGASISRLSKKYENIVFLLWGSVAGKYEHYINKDNNHLVIRCEHPTNAFYEKREWYHNNCFSETNEYLKENGKEEIRW